MMIFRTVDIGVASFASNALFSECPDRKEMSKDAQVNVSDAVREHYQRVYYFCLHLTRNPDDAADLVQYTYEMLVRNVDRISDPSKVKSWLHSTAYRKFIDQRRRATRFPSVEFEEDQLPGRDPGPERDNSIDAKAALQALHRLDDDLRAPLSLFYLEDYSYKEIADALDLPTGTVMSRLYRGKKRLYAILTGAPL